MTRSAPRGNILTIKVATGTVVDGKVVVEGEALAEGSTVTVVLREDDETFELTPEDEAECCLAIYLTGGFSRYFVMEVGRSPG